MKVNVREILETVVEADSIEDAETMYNKGEFELTAEDLKAVEFTEVEALT